MVASTTYVTITSIITITPTISHIAALATSISPSPTQPQSVQPPTMSADPNNDGTNSGGIHPKAFVPVIIGAIVITIVFILLAICQHKSRTAKFSSGYRDLEMGRNPSQQNPYFNHRSRLPYVPSTTTAASPRYPPTLPPTPPPPPPKGAYPALRQKQFVPECICDHPSCTICFPPPPEQPKKIKLPPLCTCRKTYCESCFPLPPPKQVVRKPVASGNGNFATYEPSREASGIREGNVVSNVRNLIPQPTFARMQSHKASIIPPYPESPNLSQVSLEVHISKPGEKAAGKMLVVGISNDGNIFAMEEDSEEEDHDIKIPPTRTLSIKHPQPQRPGKVSWIDLYRSSSEKESEKEAAASPKSVGLLDEIEGKGAEERHLENAQEPHEANVEEPQLKHNHELGSENLEGDTDFHGAKLPNF